MTLSLGDGYIDSTKGLLGGLTLAAGRHFAVAHIKLPLAGFQFDLKIGKVGGDLADELAVEPIEAGIFGGEFIALDSHDEDHGFFGNIFESEAAIFVERDFVGIHGMVAAPIYAQGVSPDGKWILTASDGDGKVWDAANGAILLKIPEVGRWAAFSPNGDRIVIGVGNTRSKVFDSATGQEQLTLKGHSGPVAFSSNGQRIATGGEDETARVWDAQTGVELMIYRGHSSVVHRVSFSKNGLRLLTASNDGSARLWDVETGKELLCIRGHGAGLSNAAFSPNDDCIATASYDGTAKIWSIRQRESPPVKK